MYQYIWFTKKNHEELDELGELTRAGSKSKGQGLEVRGSMVRLGVQRLS
jgi:hypothetical protein